MISSLGGGKHERMDAMASTSDRLPAPGPGYGRLLDKVAVITGSSRGIGAAISRAFAREGATVIITYKEQEAQARLVAADCGSAMVCKMDVRSRDDVRACFTTARDRYGRIDILVNNAGVNRTADFDKLTESDWDYVLDTDLKGVFLCCQEVLPVMSDKGRIINIGSLSGEYGGPRTPSYAAAKAGVMALTHCLARFVGPRGICVNCLSPGVIENEFTASSMSGCVRETVRSLLLLNRFGTYEDIVGAAVFLASGEAGYITGQTLSINGGAWVR